MQLSPLSTMTRWHSRGWGGRRCGCHRVYRLEPTTRELRVRVRTDRRVIPLLADHGHLLAPSGSILSSCCCASEHLGSFLLRYRLPPNFSLVRVFTTPPSPHLLPHGDDIRRMRIFSTTIFLLLFFFFSFSLYTSLLPSSFLLCPPNRAYLSMRVSAPRRLSWFFGHWILTIIVA